MGVDVHAGRWLLTGLAAAAVAAGLVMGDLTAAAIDPYYRQVDAQVDDTPPIDVVPTQPPPIVFTPISTFGEWPDAAPPPPEENIFDEPVAMPTYDRDEPFEPTLPDPEPVPAMLSEPPAPTAGEPSPPAPIPADTGQPAEPLPPAS
jgi:hypothetical protein